MKMLSKQNNYHKKFGKLIYFLLKSSGEKPHRNSIKATATHNINIYEEIRG